MRHVVALAASAVLLCCTAFAERPEKRVSTQHITFIAPSSFDELWNESHLVAHVRVLGGRTELKKSEAAPNAKHVFTAHRIKILDIYRTNVSVDCAALATDVTQCAPQRGDELVLLQQAGEVETSDEIVRIADETPLRSGADYVVFLVWHAPLKTFISKYGPHGAFEIRDGLIHATSKGGRVASEQEGKPSAAFAEELRRKAGKR